MLTYELFDIYGKKTKLKYPLSVKFTSSDDAPADSLNVTFAVSGNIPEIATVTVENGNERLFSGIVDTQTEEESPDGILLTISARSLECILLDNEALPQTYCMPSMPLIVERHLAPLGFTEYIGERKSFSGEMIISKGMSEWAVLETFCRRFLETKPKIDCYGVIDITGSESDEIIYLSESRCISKKHILDRSKLISEIDARTYIAGGYEMTLENKNAKALGVRRKRYVNSIDSESRTVLSARKIISESNNSYEQIVADFSGCILCSVDAKAVLDKENKIFRVKRTEYSLNSNGEKTRLYMERDN